MIHWLTNQTPNNHTDSMFRLFQTMASAGWQTIAWSDGTTAHNTPIANPYPYSSANTGFTAGYSAIANGLDNSRAWIVLQQPPSSASLTVGATYAGTRQYVFQRSTSDDRLWRMKYSFSGGYTSPSVAGTSINAPSINSVLNDEQFICGGGTDASPTFDYVFAGVDGGSHVSIAADDGYFVSGSNPYPYGFYLVGWTAGVPSGLQVAIMMDPMISGSFPVSDPDPFVHHRCNANSVGSGFPFDPLSGQQRFSDSLQASVGLCWLNKNGPNQRWVGMSAAWYKQFPLDDHGGWPSGIGSNAITNEEDLIPVPYIRYAGAIPAGGYKGLSGFMKYLSSTKTTGTALSQNSNRDRLAVSKVAIPWDGSLPLV